MTWGARAGLVVSLVAGLAADYPWGDWVGHSHWARVGWIPFVSWPLSLPDIAQNLLLFAPVGFFSTLVFSRRSVGWAAGLTAPVSLLGEWTQVYSHTRFPSATDFACNVAGAILTSPRAIASRRVTGFSPTSTIRIRPRPSRCVNRAAAALRDEGCFLLAIAGPNMSL